MVYTAWVRWSCVRFQVLHCCFLSIFCFTIWDFCPLFLRKMVNLHLGWFQQIISDFLDKLCTEFTPRSYPREMTHIPMFGHSVIKARKSEVQWSIRKELQAWLHSEGSEAGPQSLGTSGMARRPEEQGHSCSKLDLVTSGSPSPFPSGWKDFLSRMAAVPEFILRGSYYSAQV